MVDRFSKEQQKEIKKLASEVVEKEKDKFVRLKPSTVKDLKTVGLFAETYDQVVKALIEMYQDFNRLLSATSRSEAETKAIASRLSQKYAARIRQLKVK